MLPTFFISHGAPTLVLQRTAASAFLKQLSTLVERPKAILIVSAHWEEALLTIGTGTETIHDFYGFPEALYRLNYPAPVAGEVATQAAALLELANEPCVANNQRGRDHGMWVPLMLAWPRADIPVAQLSLVRGASPERYFEIGQALRVLREDGVLIIGSGSASHNLRYIPSTTTAPWAAAFIDWLNATLDARDDQALLAWQSVAPHAQTNHPTTEHFDPIFIARGAAAGETSSLVHASWEFGSLPMNVYRFGA